MRTIVALLHHSMATEYGRTPGGSVWSVLNPLGVILALSVGFELLQRTPSLGTSFLLFFATGYLPYVTFLQVSNGCSASVNYGRLLMRFPAIRWSDIFLARALFRSVIGIVVSVVILSGIAAFSDARFTIDFQYILLSYAGAIVLGTGIGSVNASFFVFAPVWKSVWGILTRPLFILSGVVFLYEEMPPLAQKVLWWNPLMHITGLARRGYYYGYPAEYVSVEYFMACAAVSLLVGLAVLRRNYDTLIYR